MLEAADALVAKNRTVAGRSGLVSLCDVGYCSVGVDEGWEGCGAGVNGTQHAADGTPTIDAAFPNTSEMVKDIHAKGLAAGWYLNGCKCGERTEKEINYEGDVRSLHGFDFDGVKIDGCGRQRNQTLYAALMQESGKNYTIENCHWGDCTSSDDSSCPTADWCPWNWYRTSGDINSGAESWLSNLQTTIKFQDKDAPLSVPGCWAYPDMLEVGRVAEPAPGTFFSWNRAHFGAWCVVSAPLILGLELTDAKLGPIMDIITNEEAIAVNQLWQGHPGRLVESVTAPPTPYSPSGAVVPSSSAGDFQLEGGADMRPSRPDAATSGASNIRTGGPGGHATIKIGTGVVGGGHHIDAVSLTFRYVAGYTPPPGQNKTGPTVTLALLDPDTDAVLKRVASVGNLSAYSYDNFKGYSPPIPLSGSGLDVPDSKPVVVALLVDNVDRNLQIPVDDKAAGFNVRVQWQKTGTATETATAAAAANSNAAGVAATATTKRRQLVGSGVFGAGQVWCKKQGADSQACLVINQGSQPLKHTLDLTKLDLAGGTKTYSVRDIWQRKDAGTVTTGTLSVTVPPYDSAFLLFK